MDIPDRIAMVIPYSLDVVLMPGERLFISGAELDESFLGLFEQMGEMTERLNKEPCVFASFILKTESEEWEIADIGDGPKQVLLEAVCPSCKETKIYSYIDKRLIGLLQPRVPMLEERTDDRGKPMVYMEIFCCFKQGE